MGPKETAKRVFSHSKNVRINTASRLRSPFQRKLPGAAVRVSEPVGDTPLKDVEDCPTRASSENFFSKTAQLSKVKEQVVDVDDMKESSVENTPENKGKEAQTFDIRHVR